MVSDEIKKYLSEIGKEGAKKTNKNMSKEQMRERSRLGGLAKAKNRKKKK